MGDFVLACLPQGIEGFFMVMDLHWRERRLRLEIR